MGTEDTAAGAQAAPTTTAPAAAPAITTPAAEPTRVDPRAAAMAMLDRGRESATTDPQKPAEPAAAKPAEPAPAPAAKPVDPEAQPDRLASGFARLAREKAALHTEREAIKAERTELQALRDMKAAIAKDPASVLALLGAASDDEALERVAEAFIARKAGKQEPSAEERLAALETERANERKAAEDAKKAADQAKATQTLEQQIEGSVSAIKENLAAAKEQFPTVLGLGEERQVFDAVSAYVAKHKLSAEQITFDLVRTVAAGVEAALAEDISGLVEKAPHIAARVTPPRQETASTGQPTDTGAKGTSSTSLASTQVIGSVPPPTPGKRYTKEELRAAALAHFAPPG